MIWFFVGVFAFFFRVHSLLQRILLPFWGFALSSLVGHLHHEGDQQEKDCYHGDEDASRDPRSVETRPPEKRGNPAHSTHFTDRRGYALWPSSLVWTCPETRCGQCHSHSDEPGNTRYQTTRTPQEDVEPTTEGRHDGRGCDPGYGPRPDGVETEDKADPYEIGKRPLKVSKVSIHNLTQLLTTNFHFTLFS